jgi:hypothetical protein
LYPELDVLSQTGEECDTWLEAQVAIALELQRPLPAERLAIVATGQRQDAAAAELLFYLCSHGSLWRCIRRSTSRSA